MARRRDSGTIEGINVTPLVDITLVLLVVFIVTAKMVVQPAVPLDLPAAAQGEEVQTIFAVSLPKDGSLWIDGEEAKDEALEIRARAALVENPDLRAIIQADGDVPHRRVIGILDRLKGAGVVRVAFGTSFPEPEAAGDRR